MGETPKTALPHHATPVALSRETRKGALAQLFAKSKIQNGISSPKIKIWMTLNCKLLNMYTTSAIWQNLIYTNFFEFGYR
ncbi:hypothetical protein BV378_24960 [Nostoc sp. RF31YmG]|nr:hypothetical protein BV378_24960 [Nostoc sp. RF31YmG]OUL26254.1 hypothetical protein BV375_21425 [Nostoc sp. 106C]